MTALDTLTIAPERFTPELGVYLGLRSIYYDLRNARSDDALREVVARMWQMALQIEDGNVSQAEQALRQAQDALRQALERGASDEELKKLMDNLRAAMDKFLQALAEEMRKNPQALSRPLDRNTRMLSQQDLKSMMDRLEQMARSGNKDAAKQLLDQLQAMLENLQTARPGAQGEDGDDDMNSALDELSDMIRKQQQLRDKTFKQGQDMRRDRQRGQRGQGKQQLGDLRQDQQALKDRLKSCSSSCASAVSAIRSKAKTVRVKKAKRARAKARWASSATPAKRWARPKAISAKATPRARSAARAVRSKPCARARKVWRSRCSSRAWARVRAGPAATAASAPTRTPIRSAGRYAAANMATTLR